MNGKIKYSDGNDYSALEPNIESLRDDIANKYYTWDNDNGDCVVCGEFSNVTILNDKDICHNCCTQRNKSFVIRMRQVPFYFVYKSFDSHFFSI